MMIGHYELTKDMLTMYADILPGFGPMKITQLTTTPMTDTLLSKTLDEKISSPNRVAVTPDSYASVLVGFPELVRCQFVCACVCVCVCL